MKHNILVFILLFSGSFLSHANEILIRQATVSTMSEAGTLDNVDIYIKDGIIQQIGTNLEASPDVREIDAAGMQVTPGLINSYTALGIIEIGAVDATVDVETDDEMFSTSYNISPAFNPASSLLPLNRNHGLTLAIVAPDSGHHVFAGQAAMAHLRQTGDLLIDRSVAMFARFGARAGRFAGGSRAAAYAKLRHAFADTQEYLANRDAVLQGDWRELSLPKHDLDALIPVVDGVKPLVIDVHRASDIRALLELKQEFNLNLIIIGGAEAWMVADELAADKVPVILDPMYNLPG
ncbi:MAG: imidazolonepropionase, partial [Gammaproteobacteria bacterium]|nr:imidazolonepropionase [Gammaproteobacteria bacterium]